MKRTILIALALFAVVALPASAARPQTTTPPLALTQEILREPFDGPTWCLNEDDQHYRQWIGSLSGGFSTSEYYCNSELYNGQYWDGGGQSVGVDINGTGTLSSLLISGQDVYGTHFERVQAVLVSTEVIGHGKNAQTWRRYDACVSLRSPDYGLGPFGGTWTISISGTFTYLQLTEESTMFPIIEGKYCPAGQGP
jgi:hypothetical protein